MSETPPRRAGFIHKRADDPEHYDPCQDRRWRGLTVEEVEAMIEAAKGGQGSQVALDTKLGKLSLMGRDALAMLVVVILGAVGVGVVYHVKDTQKDMALAIINESRARRVSDEWNRYGHELLHYDGLRKDCILLISAQQREQVNQEMNRDRTLAPLQWRCQWLGDAPVKPTMSP